MAYSPEIEAFADTARRFARQEVQPMVGTEGRDGMLESLPGLLDKAASIGLLASSDPESPGYDLGVWGLYSREAGPAASLVILEELAIECAGVAACLHFAGLGAQELYDTPHKPASTALAFFEDTWRLTPEALSSPPEHTTALTMKKGRSVASGKKSFIHALPGFEAIVIYAARDHKWERLCAPLKAKGLRLREAGQRTGLAALEVYHLELDQMYCTAKSMLEPRSPALFLRRHLLGLSAIALGNARGALKAAACYARERFQGGSMIAAHPAIQLLIGEAASRIDAASAQLRDGASRDADDGPSLNRAIALKLRVTTSCSQAVTDCLQVLGGYGYMEDYRLEKRLRDALTLKSLALRPDDLRMLLAGAVLEER